MDIETLIALYAIVLVFTLIFASLRLLTVYIFKYEIAHKMKLWGYYVLIYMGLFTIGFILIRNYTYIQDLIDGLWPLFFYLMALAIFEIIPSYFLFYRQQGIIIYLIFVLSSYALLLFGFVFLISILGGSILLI